MLRDLQINHADRMLDVIRYSSVDRLIEVLDTDIIGPAQVKVCRPLEIRGVERGALEMCAGQRGILELCSVEHNAFQM